MGKKAKLFQKALTSPQNINFEDFITLLLAFGFELARVRGSHHIFSHRASPELLSIQPRGDGKAKPYQLRQFFTLVEQYNLHLEEDRE